MENEEMQSALGSEVSNFLASGEQYRGKVEWALVGNRETHDRISREVLFVTDRRLIFTSNSANSMHRTDILTKDIESFSCATKHTSKPIYMVFFSIFCLLTLFMFINYAANLEWGVSYLPSALFYLFIAVIFLVLYLFSRKTVAYLNIFVRGSTQNIFEIGNSAKLKNGRNKLQVRIDRGSLDHMAELIGKAISEVENR